MLYKQLIRKHNLSGSDITITWNTDGVPVFKSSLYSIWPIQCMVNELPPHLRSSNILMTGLWFGKTKPCMNTFLTPFVEECRELERSGFVFKVERVPRKVFSLICSVDSPARAMVRNCKQFNGEYGCDWCEHPGECVLRENGPPTRYYPFRGDPVLRTARRQAKYAIKANETGEAVMVLKEFRSSKVSRLLIQFEALLLNTCIQSAKVLCVNYQTYGWTLKTMTMIFI